MNRELIRRTLVGAAVGALLFGGVALYQAARSGAPFPRVLLPIGFFTVLGLTVGGLAGPLLGQAFARLRAQRRPGSMP
jgi:hypothetical protein